MSEQSVSSERKGSVDVHRKEAQELVSLCRVGSLGTLEASGYPYVSHVEIAVSEDYRIYMLLSDLAVHTRNVRRDDRVSMVVVDPSAEWILSTRRATFQGRLRCLEGKPEDVREVILGSHPDSGDFIDFADFHFFELEVENVRYIKGFGEMSRFSWTEEQ